MISITYTHTHKFLINENDNPPPPSPPPLPPTIVATSPGAENFKQYQEAEETLEQIGPTEGYL